LNLLTKKQQQEIKTHFETLGTKIHFKRDIEEILISNWDLWDLPRNMRMADLLDHLIKAFELKEIVLNSPNYNKRYVRYAWRKISVYQLSLSLRPRSYLSHHSAMYLNGLTAGPQSISSFIRIGGYAV